MSPGPGAAAGRDPGPVFAVRGGRPVMGRVRVPGDKSISHRALLLGALAPGESVVRGLSDGDDVARTATALRRLGARLDPRDGPGTMVVTGGVDSLHGATGPLDV